MVEKPSPTIQSTVTPPHPHLGILQWISCWTWEQLCFLYLALGFWLLKYLFLPGGPEKFQVTANSFRAALRVGARPWLISVWTPLGLQTQQPHSQSPRPLRQAFLSIVCKIHLLWHAIGEKQQPRALLETGYPQGTPGTTVKEIKYTQGTVLALLSLRRVRPAIWCSGKAAVTHSTQNPEGSGCMLNAQHAFSLHLESSYDFFSQLKYGTISQDPEN